MTATTTDPIAMTFAIAWSGGSGTRYQALTALKIATRSQYQSGGTTRPTRWSFGASPALSPAILCSSDSVALSVIVTEERLQRKLSFQGSALERGFARERSRS